MGAGTVNKMIEGNEEQKGESHDGKALRQKKIVMMGEDKLYLHYLLPIHQFSLK